MPHKRQIIQEKVVSKRSAKTASFTIVFVAAGIWSLKKLRQYFVRMSYRRSIDLYGVTLDGYDKRDVHEALAIREHARNVAITGLMQLGTSCELTTDVALAFEYFTEADWWLGKRLTMEGLEPIRLVHFLAMHGRSAHLGFAESEPRKRIAF